VTSRLGALVARDNVLLSTEIQCTATFKLPPRAHYTLYCMF